MLFLPGYSPQLNADELLNQDVKSHIGRRRAKDQTERMSAMRSRLRGTQRQPEKVKRYFHERYVAYAEP
ncbi:MAG: hypothetical protein JJU36_13020 [Phycisphaeraceae bacterium]|nr:hypothetical protein [Phycisphaeraceae bacterium]